MNFAIADKSAERQLRTLTEAESMPGRLRIRMTRAPSFFDAISIHGHEVQVPVLLDGPKVIGTGLRCRRQVYLNGQPTPFGYLGGLHLAPSARSHIHLARAYRYLKDLHEQNPVLGYMTTIMQANNRAKSLLTSNRAGLPDYLPFGRLRCLTYARSIPHGKVQTPSEICTGDDIGADALTGYLNECGRNRPFFPVIKPDDFGTPWLRGLDLADFRVICRNGRIDAAAALWDQRDFRQTVVDGYDSIMTLMRPALNLAARLTGRPRLPRPGCVLPLAYIAFFCVRDQDPETAAILLNAMLERPMDQHAPRFLSLGIHEADPMVNVLAAHPHVEIISHIFLVCWADTRESCAMLRSLVPHIELAMC